MQRRLDKMRCAGIALLAAWLIVGCRVPVPAGAQFESEADAKSAVDIAVAPDVSPDVAAGVDADAALPPDVGDDAGDADQADVVPDVVDVQVATDAEPVDASDQDVQATDVDTGGDGQSVPDAATETAGGDAFDADAQTDDVEADVVSPDIEVDPCAALVCDDGNVCTDDSCVSTSGCVHLSNTATCTDNDVCTSGDVCGSGLCQAGSLLNCADGNACTDDFCDALSGCGNQANTASCDDGSVCTESDACVDSVCKGAAVSCEDEKVCTLDTCDAATGCAHADISAPCDDGNACSTGDACSGGLCKGSGGVECDDSNPCTVDTCDAVGGCKHVAQTDGWLCSAAGCGASGYQAPAVCSSGACGTAPVAVDCDDQNVCTTDSCSPDQGCLHVANTLPCSDGNACTQADTCEAKVCVGSVVQCNDGNACTDDSCDKTDGCKHAANAALCDDQDACTTGDACSATLCVGVTVTCDDSDACTVDSCDKDLGCKSILTGNAFPEACNGVDDNCSGQTDEGCDDDQDGYCDAALDWTAGAGLTCPNTTGLGTRDCDDAVLGISPGATETCNSIDDNCDGQTDEGLGTTTCGIGACTRTVDNCLNGVMQACDAGQAVTETCNGLDDDCNGTDDDDPIDVGGACGENCPGGLVANCKGICQAGMVVCQTGAKVCMGSTGPAAEVCNYLDDDCDGTLDNGITDPWKGEACCSTGTLSDCQNSGGGTRCSTGSYLCSAGVKACSANVAKSTEVCDSVDNDCNGSVDDILGLGGDCSGGGTNTNGACKAAYQCNGMPGPGPYGLTCAQTVGPQPETCNGADDNCDGATDEGLGASSCGIGACVRWVSNCLDGVAQACVPGEPAAEVVCNGIDENCNGFDEVAVTTCGVGQCKHTVSGCGACVPLNAGTETCNGLDDNCNGVTDDIAGLGGACTGGGTNTTGACTAKYTCGGTPGPGPNGLTCGQSVGPQGETCNGADDNCDGSTDEGVSCDDGNPCTGDSCSGASGCLHAALGADVSCGAGKVCDGVGGCASVPSGMAVIPAGTFWMGCNTAKDANCQADESPQHKVTLSPYFMDLTETTVAQYKACVDAGVCTAPSSVQPTLFATYPGLTNNPVNFVNWIQARQFCQWRGAGFDLPTEAQWEMAARGSCEKNGSLATDPACKTAMRTYPWGEAPATCSYAVMTNGTFGCGTNATWEVGAIPAGDSPYGLHDMTGNLWEWVRDWYASYAPGDQIDPAGPSTASTRVYLGGSFGNGAVSLRAGGRNNGAEPYHNAFYLGGRCMRSFPIPGPCTAQTEGQLCSDGNACTTDDVCVGGQCKAGAPAACGSNATCSPTQGCACTPPWQGNGQICTCPPGFLTLDVDGKATCAADYPVWGLRSTSPGSLFADNGDGTVTDSQSKLQWQQGYAAQGVQWAAATAACNSLVLGGHSDWRVPTASELQTTLDYGSSAPTVVSAFAAAPADTIWSATPYLGPGTAAFLVALNPAVGNPSLTFQPTSYAARVRCVRSVAAPVIPSTRFTVNGADGTVLDHATGLTWQQDATSPGSTVWNDKLCNDLTLAGGGWRLPTIVELQSIVDRSRYGPSSDPAFAFTCDGGIFFSVNSLSSATWMATTNGVCGLAGWSSSGCYRCVR